MTTDFELRAYHFAINYPMHREPLPTGGTAAALPLSYSCLIFMLFSIRLVVESAIVLFQWYIST